MQLAPLYDAVPVHLWPEYSEKFAMPVGKAYHPADLTERNWRLFATESGLDPDVVCEEAFTIMGAVAERYLDCFADAGADQARMSMISKYVQKLRQPIPAAFK